MGLDFSKYDPLNLEKHGVRLLLESMCTTLDANDRIVEFLRLADPALSLSLLDELSQDPDPEISCRAVELLVRIEGAKALKCVGGLLGNRYELARGAACSLLSELDSAESRSYLVRALETDESAIVRYAAVDGLEAIGDESSLPALRRAAENDEGTDFEGRPIRDKAVRSISIILSRERERNER